MFVRSLVMIAMVLAVASSTEARQDPDPPQTTPAPFTAGWNDGFVLQSADGDYRLTFGMVAQTDGRFALDEPLPITNTFVIRKIRPTLSGRVARYFDFKVMPDFGNGQTIVLDAYLDMRFSTKFRIRTGKDKTPVGYELLIGDAFVLFPERSLVSSLVPNRDIGVQAQGDLVRGKFGYAGGLFNGIPDGTSLSTEVDSNSDKDFGGRIVVQPFRATGTAASGPLNGLGFHVGGTYGDQSGPLPSFRTSVGQAFFSYAAGATAAGTRRRVSPAVFYYYKSLGAFAEYARSTQDVARGAVARQVTNNAWDVTVSYVVTGEAASDRGVKPRNSFDPAKGQWGALQLLARYSDLFLDRDIFAFGLASAGSSRTARQWTVGANWYPNAWIKWYGTYERTVFDEDSTAVRPSEDVILFRIQLAF